MKKIIISGYYGYKNSGDDAILSSICRDLRSLSIEEDIIILSNTPKETEEEYGFESKYRFSITAIFSCLSKAKLLLMGGGSLLQDGTSSRSLYYYLSLILLAKIFGARVILYANGMGPINKKLNRFLTRLVVNRVDTITLREHLSLETLKELKINKPKTVVTADPVFNMGIEDFNNSEEIYEKEKIDKSSKMVGVMFRNWQHEETYVKKIAEICDRIVEKYDMTIIFIPMKYPKDIQIASQIQSKMKKPSHLIKNHYSADKLISFIKDMKLVLSMRLHALIYASINHVPMIGFNYDPKVVYYIKELDMVAVNQMQHIRVDQVMEIVEDMLENPKKYQDRLEKNVNRLKKEAGENKKYLEELI